MNDFKLKLRATYLCPDVNHQIFISDGSAPRRSYPEQFDRLTVTPAPYPLGSCYAERLVEKGIAFEKLIADVFHRNNNL